MYLICESLLVNLFYGRYIIFFTEHGEIKRKKRYAFTHNA